MPNTTLSTIERLRDRFGERAAAAKLAALADLARTRLRSAREVERLHEVLCFLRAYADDARVLAQVERMLAGFERRPDLRAQRDRLVDTGIAGTVIRYRFFYATALWLARRWPAQLHLDRSDIEADALIGRALAVLITPVEAAALRELKLTGYAALDRLRARSQTDASFLVEQIAGMPGNGLTRQNFADAIDASFELRPGADTPSRTHAKFAGAPMAWQTAALRRDRPDLRTELGRAPRSMRLLSPPRGRQIVDLARAAMVTRARALEAFSYGNPRDVWLVDDGAGLAFAFAGVAPDRRPAIPAIYGGLMLRNGVPIGYLQADIVGPTAAVSFNTFATFRGGEAARTFARMLAALRHLFGTTSFSIEPYQLGQGNDEGLESGAWWFYFKLGFRPRAADARRLARAEQARMRASPTYRSNMETLRQLAQRHLFFDLDPRRPQPLPPLAQIGLRAGQALAQRAASRRAAVADCAREAVQRCGLPSLRGFSAAERAAWFAWSPLIALLPRLERWRPAQRRELCEIIRAKAAPSEREFAVRFAAHPRLARELLGATLQSRRR